MCHKVFPPLPVAAPLLGWESRIRWQAVQQTATSATHQPAPIRRETASGFCAAHMAALMGWASGGDRATCQARALAGSALSPNTPPSAKTLLPPHLPVTLPCPWHKNRAHGVNLTKITTCPRGILLPFRIPHPQSTAVNLPPARSRHHPLVPACFLWKGHCCCGC